MILSVILFLLESLLCIHNAFAATLPIDPSKYQDPTVLIGHSIPNALVKTVGLLTDHRPYSPATGLPPNPGIEFGLEITAVRVPGDLSAALEEVGAKLETPPLIPLPRLMVRKSFGSRAELGLSAIKYKIFRAYGGDFKIVIFDPEDGEGVTWAARVNASWANLGLVYVQTTTPQVLISRRMDFADPYIGVGYQMMSGEIKLDYMGIKLKSEGNAKAFMSFMGVKFRSDLTKLYLALEGSYNSGGGHTLGTSFGLSF